MEKFKTGDLVYDLRGSGVICEVIANPSTHTQYKLLTIDDGGRRNTYTKNGLFSVDDTLPTLVKATDENREALVLIFGDVFQKLEDYKAAPTSADVIKELINKQGFAWCGASDCSKNDARGDGKFRLHKIVNVVEDEKFGSEFHVENGTIYLYAVPFDPNTGDEITSLED